MKKYRSKYIQRVMSMVSIDSEIKVRIECFFLQKCGGYMLMPVNENGEVSDDVEKLNDSIMNEAKPIIDTVMGTLQPYLEKEKKSKAKTLSTFQKEINKLHVIINKQTKALQKRKRLGNHFDTLTKKLMAEGRITKEEVKQITDRKI